MHGSGAIGLEAVSRGAKKTILCDNNKSAVEIIKKNIEKTKTQDKVEVYQKTFEELIKRNLNEKVDIVYLDPPYDTNYAYEATNMLIKEEKINLDSIIIIETDQKDKVKKELEKLKIDIYDERKYGRANLIFLKYQKA